MNIRMHALGWHNVEDRQPAPVNRLYLVRLETGTVTCATYDGELWDVTDAVSLAHEDITAEITHWAELPDFPGDLL